MMMYTTVLCVCVCLTEQSAVARSSWARWETLSLCTETDTNNVLPGTIQYQLSVILQVFSSPKRYGNTCYTANLE